MNMDDIVTHVYRTRDFEFVIAAMSLGDPRLKVIDLTPFAIQENDRAGKHRRVTLDIVGVDADGMTFDVCERMEVLRLEYANGELRVDPLKVFSQQRNLRAMIVDAPRLAAGSNNEVSVSEGSKFQIVLVREGKKPDQAIGYLTDGTMVVIDGGKSLIGSDVQITVTRVLHVGMSRTVFGTTI